MHRLCCCRYLQWQFVSFSDHTFLPKNPSNLKSFLPAKFVIHTVGPVWHGKPKESELLANCYTHTLQLAVENKCKTVAFPNISTGVYRFPKDEAAVIAVKTVAAFLRTTNEIVKVIFACFDEENFYLIQRELDKVNSR